VRRIINGACHEPYEKRLEQHKGGLNVNGCAAEENLEEDV